MTLDQLDRRLKTLLPEEYQESYESLEPTPMGAAGLKFDATGRVAWNEIWGSFCDLAMAGGPPHKGSLLEPATPAEISAAPDQYEAVTAELCRAITMVTELPATTSPVPGWVRVDCYSDTMAGWLLRAVTMENVAATANHRALDLPASPHFRLDKETKNVVTVIAKTNHYWDGHLPRLQSRAIAALFAELALETPLVAPALSTDPALATSVAPANLATTIQRETGLLAASPRYANWFGMECPGVRAAVWMMRALVACNVLARREGTTLFVPINPLTDLTGGRTAAVVVRAHGLARAHRVID